MSELTGKERDCTCARMSGGGTLSVSASCPIHGDGIHRSFVPNLPDPIATLDRMLADERRENDDLQQQIADLTRERDAAHAHACEASLEERDLRARLAVLEARTPEQLAQQFHEAYERLAPQFGYETREASRKPWADVPEQNKRLMVAAIDALLAPSSPADKEQP